MGRNDVFNEFWELWRKRNELLLNRYINTVYSLPCNQAGWKAIWRMDAENRRTGWTQAGCDGWADPM